MAKRRDLAPRYRNVKVGKQGGGVGKQAGGVGKERLKVGKGAKTVGKKNEILDFVVDLLTVKICQWVSHSDNTGRPAVVLQYQNSNKSN